MLIDSHAHLDHPKLLPQLSSVVERAVDGGVGAILTVFCIEDSRNEVDAALRMVEELDGVYAAIGVHPHDACSLNDDIEDAIFSAMAHSKVLGWGEIGLDFYYDHSPREVQIEAFRRQVRRARAAGRPMIIHSRNAVEETCRVLREEVEAIDFEPGVMHCFTYGMETATRCLELGFCLGFGGLLTFPRSVELREIASTVPEERILIETDSPYLAPVPFRGKTNEPAYVASVAEVLGGVRGTSGKSVGDRTSSNFCRLFGLNQDFRRLG